MRVKERREQIKKLTEELRGLVEKRDIEKAKTKKEEIREAKELLEAEIVIEEEEERALDEANKKLEERKNKKRKEDRKMDKELEYRALAKILIGEKLNDEERATITDGNFNSNTGGIIPSEFINKVQLIRNGHKSLKNYCDVIPVTSDNGSMPTANLEDELADLEEDKEMVETMLEVQPIKYAIKDKGMLKKVGNNLLKDGAVNFIDGVLAPAFAVASINRENRDVVSVVDGESEIVTVASSDSVDNVLATTISKEVPSIRDGLIVITNSEGYSYLDNLKDNTGKKSDDITYVNGALHFKNKEVVSVADKLLPKLTEGKTMLFYIVNLKTVPFFDRQQIEIAKSTEAGFTANKTLVRVIERYDVKNNPDITVQPKKIEA